MLEELMQELNRLKQAHDLLERVWLDIGAYRNGKLTDEVWYKVQDYMKFDDSE